MLLLWLWRLLLRFFLFGWFWLWWDNGDSSSKSGLVFVIPIIVEKVGQVTEGITLFAESDLWGLVVGAAITEDKAEIIPEIRGLLV